MAPNGTVSSWYEQPLPVPFSSWLGEMWNMQHGVCCVRQIWSSECGIGIGLWLAVSRAYFSYLMRCERFDLWCWFGRP